MKERYKKWNKELKSQVKEYETAYGDIQEKIKNENQDMFHTMLMKNDFENYLRDYANDERADLQDLKLYEKELEKLGGNKKR